MTSGCPSPRRSVFVRARRAGPATKVVAFLLLGSGLVTCVHAQSAFISATGTFANNTQTQDFFFSVNNGANNLSLRTWAYGGGNNAAGIGVGSGGIDSTLTLYTGGGTSIAFNDDNSAANPGTSGFKFDSLLAYNGVGGTLLPAQPPGSYRLRLG